MKWIYHSPVRRTKPIIEFEQIGKFLHVPCIYQLNDRLITITSGFFFFFYLFEREKVREDCVVTLRVQQSQGIVSSESPEPEDNLIALNFRVQGQVGLERLVKEPGRIH